MTSPYSTLNPIVGTMTSSAESLAHMAGHTPGNTTNALLATTGT
jgi:hypothetical protein